MSVLTDAILSLLGSFFSGVSLESFLSDTHTHTLSSLVPSSRFLFFTGSTFSRFSWLRRLLRRMVTGFFCLDPQGTDIPFGVELLPPVIPI